MRNGYFTLVSNEYVVGAVCLLKSLRKHTALPFHVINLNLTNTNKELLCQHGAIIEDVDIIGSTQAKSRPWHCNENFANNCFNKLYLWNRDYDKVIYLDADMVVLKNIDHLFDIEESFAACPSYIKSYNPKTKALVSQGWSNDVFNGGFLVIKPLKEMFDRLMSLKDVLVSNNDPSDQGFLNLFFNKNWKQLPWIYNATRRAFTSNYKAWKENEDEIAVIHFTVEKPWLVNVSGHEEIERKWWNIYDSRLL